MQKNQADSIKPTSQYTQRLKIQSLIKYYKSAWLAFVMALLVVGVGGSISQTRFLLTSKASTSSGVSFKTSQTEYSVQDNITIDAWLETGGILVNAAQLVFSYDPTKLQFESIVPGEFFQNASTTLLIDSSQPGLVIAAFGFMPGNTVTSSNVSGSLASISMKSIDSGSTQIAWSESELMTTIVTSLDGQNILQTYQNLDLMIGSSSVASPSPQPTQTPIQSGFIRGTIYDSVTNEPIENASITFSIPNKKGKSGKITTVLTDYSGKYELFYDVSGTYDIEISASGYQTLTDTIIYEASNYLEANFLLEVSQKNGKNNKPGRPTQ